MGWRASQGRDDGHAAGPGLLAVCVEIVACPVAAMRIFLHLFAFCCLCPRRGPRGAAAIG